jgi:hypothetical protein
VNSLVAGQQQVRQLLTQDAQHLGTYLGGWLLILSLATAAHRIVEYDPVLTTLN